MHKQFGGFAWIFGDNFFYWAGDNYLYGWTDIPGNIGSTGFSVFKVGIVFHFSKVMF